MEIRYLYDWLSFTILGNPVSPQEVIDLIGLRDVEGWTLIRGINGYKQRYYYQGISICFDGSPEMGIFVNMSGQGCRTYESFSDFGWGVLRLVLNRYCNNVAGSRVNITRVDMACDMITGCYGDGSDLQYDTADDCNFIAVRDLEKFVRAGHWVGLFHRGHGSVSYEWSCNGDNARDGHCVTFGSPSSCVRLRIYDKAAERGVPLWQDVPCEWTRFELQLRDAAAVTAWYRASASDGVIRDFASCFLGVLKRYLRFVVPSETDTDRRRWRTCSWWASFLGSVEAFGLYSEPGQWYNVDYVVRYVQQQAGNSIALLVDLFGWSWLQGVIECRHQTYNSKQLQLLQLYHQCVDDRALRDNPPY